MSTSKEMQSLRLRIAALDETGSAIERAITASHEFHDRLRDGLSALENNARGGLAERSLLDRARGAIHTLLPRNPQDRVAPTLESSVELLGGIRHERASLQTRFDALVRIQEHERIVGAVLAALASDRLASAAKPDGDE